jgi:hypothetical protein
VRRVITVVVREKQELQAPQHLHQAVLRVLVWAQATHLLKDKMRLMKVVINHVRKLVLVTQPVHALAILRVHITPVIIPLEYNIIIQLLVLPRQVLAL